MSEVWKSYISWSQMRLLGETPHMLCRCCWLLGIQTPAHTFGDLQPAQFAMGMWRLGARWHWMLDIVVRHGPVSSIEPSAADRGVPCIHSALARGEAIQTPLSNIYSLLSTLSQPSPDGQKGPGSWLGANIQTNFLMASINKISYIFHQKT